MQPYHVGHLSTLLESLSAIDSPHLVCFSCASPGQRVADTREVFSPIERATMLDLVLAAHDLNSRVRWIFVPRFDISEWGELDFYLPRGAVRCVAESDPSLEGKRKVWDVLGVSYNIVSLSPVQVTSTMMRQAALEGGDWRPFLHESQHDYFLSIEGPARMGFL